VILGHGRLDFCRRVEERVGNVESRESKWRLLKLATRLVTTRATQQWNISGSHSLFPSTTFREEKHLGWTRKVNSSWTTSEQPGTGC
jgi:hypothetical protein